MEGFKTTAPVVQGLGVDYLPAPFEDKSNEGVTYYGWAPLGVAENEKGWRIMRETTHSGIIKREYAQGSMEFKFAWSERVNYTYSR